MKILVTGSETPVGRELMQAMTRDPEVMGITRNSLDLTTPERVNEIFLKYKPVAVIHADGAHDADECEKQPWEALRRNVLTTQNLALACLEHGAGLALISTHHVFHGTKKGPYTEWDAPDPHNVLGHSKSAAEMVVRNHLKRFHIIRTQGLFSRVGDNFVLRVMRAVVENQPFEAAEDEFTLPTWTRDFAQATTRLVRQRIYGTFHITNTGERNGLSWANWARTIVQVGGNRDFPVQPVPSRSLERPARRPLRAVLGNTFYRLQGFSMRTYEEALMAFFEDLANEASPPPSAGARKTGLIRASALDPDDD